MKKDRKVVKTFRTDFLIHTFLIETFRDRLGMSASEFINILIKNSDEFKEYIAKKKAEDKEPKLNFDDLETDKA